MSDPTPLHRMFELSWYDFFLGTATTIEAEMDLSLKQQFLDLVIRKGPEPLPRPLPDGFEDLKPHNLVTFKSDQEAFDVWALYEMICYFVNYRKQVSLSMRDLLPMTDFRLFAVSVRYPRNLAQAVALTPIQEGVYEIRELALGLRVIVVHKLPQSEHNAMLLVFSAQAEQRRYGQEHYQPHSKETSTLLYQLLQVCSEDPEMANKIEEYIRQSIDDLLKKLPAEELRKRLSPEERLEGLSPEERLEGLSPEERLEGLSLEERLEGLSPEELRAAMEAVQRKLRTNGSPPKAQ